MTLARLWMATQWILGPGCRNMIQARARQRLAPLAPGEWLDEGCGPSSQIAGILQGQLTGIDTSFRALREALSEHPASRNDGAPQSGTQSERKDSTSFVCASATALPFRTGSFNGVVSFGLLHQLCDADARLALAEMQRVLRPHGVFMVLDNVTPRSWPRRPLAALLRALDQGRHIRTEDQLRALASVPGWHLGPRFTYTWAGLEACWVQFDSMHNPPAVNHAHR